MRVANVDRGPGGDLDGEGGVGAVRAHDSNLLSVSLHFLGARDTTILL